MSSEKENKNLLEDFKEETYINFELLRVKYDALKLEYQKIRVEFAKLLRDFEHLKEVVDTWRE